MRFVLGGAVFGAVMAISFVLMGSVPGAAITSGLGVGLLFGLAMFVVVRVRAKKLQPPDQKEHTASSKRDIIFQLVLGCVLALGGTACAVSRVWGWLGIWVLLALVGVGNLLTAVIRLRKQL